MAVELARVGVHGKNAVIVGDPRAICTEVHQVWLNGDAVHDLRFLGPVVRRLDPRVNHLGPEAKSAVRTDADADLAVSLQGRLRTILSKWTRLLRSDAPRYVTGSASFRRPAVRHRMRRASHRQNRQNPGALWSVRR